jgi:APA family basic amino acid/polyamine antiporter
MATRSDSTSRSTFGIPYSVFCGSFFGIMSTDNHNPTLRRIGLPTAALLVVANMVGTGVFTTTGFLVRDLGSPSAILLAWAVGGVLALCGALTYGELAAALPRNGGEYHLLSRIYHPALGFLAGFISLVVGFSAPIAAASLAFGSYLGANLPGLPPVASALGLVVALSTIHALHVTAGGAVQNLFTVVKIALIVVFVVGGLMMGDPSRILSGGEGSLAGAAVSPAFAVGLIYISFSYSGWNGAIYLAGEVREPARTLPRALFAGTAVVMALYLGLNFIFLASAPLNELSGVVEVGHVAAIHLFGEGAGRLLSLAIALALVSSVSAMVMAGPRVYQVMGEDHGPLSFLRHRTRNGGPAAAVCLQAAVACLMVVTAAFETLLTYIGFTLSLFAGLTALGVTVLRRREPGLERPYRVWGYPGTTALFIVLSLWMIGHTLYANPTAALAGLGTLAAGAGLYFLLKRLDA